MPTYTQKQHDKIIGDAIEAKKKYDNATERLSVIEGEIVTYRKARDEKTDKGAGEKLLKANKDKLKLKKKMKKYDATVKLREKMNRDLSEGYQFKF